MWPQRDPAKPHVHHRGLEVKSEIRGPSVCISNRLQLSYGPAHHWPSPFGLSPILLQLVRTVQNLFQETSSPSGWLLFLLPEWIPVSLGSIVWTVYSQTERYKVSSPPPFRLQHPRLAHRWNFRFRAWARSERSLMCVASLFSLTQVCRWATLC